MTRKHSSSVSDAVMQQIRAGSVQMKPRSYYVTVGLVTGAVVVLAGIAVSYLMSIIFLWLRIQSAEGMAWGARARLGDAIATFPWWTVLGAAVLTALAVWLIRRQGRLYRLRVTTVALALVFGALLIGFSLSVFNIGESQVPRVRQEQRLRDDFTRPGQSQDRIRQPGWRINQ